MHGTGGGAPNATAIIGTMLPGVVEEDGLPKMMSDVAVEGAVQTVTQAFRPPVR
jgi:hypothetical protein